MDITHCPECEAIKNESERYKYAWDLIMKDLEERDMELLTIKKWLAEFVGEGEIEKELPERMKRNA